MITKIGDLIQRVTTSVKQFGINPHSEVVVCIGDTGKEMPIQHLKVRETWKGRILVIQVMSPQ